MFKNGGGAVRPESLQDSPRLSKKSLKIKGFFDFSFQCYSALIYAIRDKVGERVGERIGTGG
ncbi:hypothetical protein Misp06_00782 [Microbulbifer sp. NBRC 101763]